MSYGTPSFVQSNSVYEVSLYRPTPTHTGAFTMTYSGQGELSESQIDGFFQEMLDDLATLGWEIGTGLKRAQYHVPVTVTP